MEEVIEQITNGQLEVEVDDIEALQRELERRGTKAYVVRYEDAYSANPFLATLVSLFDAHMAKCATEFALSRGVSVHMLKSRGELYLLLTPV